jgi:hypothetical protein
MREEWLLYFLALTDSIFREILREEEPTVRSVWDIWAKNLKLNITKELF